MARARAVVVGLLVAVLGFGLGRAAAQSNSPPVAWEKHFPKSIGWVLRVSSGVLLVRSGNTLFAVDGKDGRELWSMSGLDLGDPEERGKNLSEIPATPILLLRNHDAKPRIEGSSGSLLGVDLWKGTVLWQQKLAADLLIEKGLSGSSTIENLMEIIPFYENDRVLLVNKVGRKGDARPRLQLQNMLTGVVEWRRKYPFKRYILGGIKWCEFDGHFMPYKLRFYVFGSSHRMQRLDLQTGKKVWSLIGCASSSLDPILPMGKSPAGE